MNESNAESVQFELQPNRKLELDRQCILDITILIGIVEKLKGTKVLAVEENA